MCCLKHWPVWLAWVILIWLVAQYRPLVLDIDSAKVSNVFRLGLPDAMFISKAAWDRLLSMSTFDFEQLKSLIRPDYIILEWRHLR